MERIALSYTFFYLEGVMNDYKAIIDKAVDIFYNFMIKERFLFLFFLLCVWRLPSI